MAFFLEASSVSGVQEIFFLLCKTKMNTLYCVCGSPPLVSHKSQNYVRILPHNFFKIKIRCNYHCATMR
jgi:hypothetical protein